MKAFIYIPFLIVSCFLSTGSAWNKEMLLIYSSVINNEQKRIYYSISTDENGGIKIRVNNQDNKTEIISFSPGFRFEKQTTYDPDGKPVMNVSFNYSSGKINLSGLYNVQYDMRTNLLDQDSSLCFQFSHYLPEHRKVFNFELLLSMNNRIVGMYLKEMGTEVLNISGDKEETVKYELGVNGILESLFWPYKYYYWYRMKDRLFVKYEGVEGNKDTNMLLLEKIEVR